VWGWVRYLTPPPPRRRRCHGVNWIQLTFDRVQWRALVNSILTFWVPQKAERLVTVSSRRTVVYEARCALILWIYNIAEEPAMLLPLPEQPLSQESESVYFESTHCGNMAAPSHQL
jgi:hypothetical protein